MILTNYVQSPIPAEPTPSGIQSTWTLSNDAESPTGTVYHVKIIASDWQWMYNRTIAKVPSELAGKNVALLIWSRHPTVGFGMELRDDKSRLLINADVPQKEVAGFTVFNNFPIPADAQTLFLRSRWALPADTELDLGPMLLCTTDDRRNLSSLGLDYFDGDTMPLPGGGAVFLALVLLTCSWWQHENHEPLHRPAMPTETRYVESRLLNTGFGGEKNLHPNNSRNIRNSVCNPLRQPEELDGRRIRDRRPNGNHIHRAFPRGRNHYLSGFHHNRFQRNARCFGERHFLRMGSRRGIETSTVGFLYDVGLDADGGARDPHILGREHTTPLDYGVMK